MPQLHYRPLDYNKYEIRLLKLLPAFADYEEFSIECELAHFSLLQARKQFEDDADRRPEYVALSYAWGDASEPETIRVNGVKVQVTRSLYQALRELRRPERGVQWLWVDALCINQHDLSEKGGQINRMSRIYAKALAVIAWIGPDNSTSALATKALQIIGPYCSTKREGKLERDALFGLHRGVAAIPELLQRPYWKRKWIIQEISKAARVGVICGRSEILPLKTFIMPCLASFGRYLAGPDVRDLLISLQHFRYRERPRFRSIPRMSLSETLIRSRHSLAQDPRDFVFAMLDLAKDGNDLVQMPNYFQTPKEVFQEMSRTMIEMQGQVPLVLLARTSRRTIEQNSLLHCAGARGPLDQSDCFPSWSPNWSSLDTRLPPWILGCIAQSQAQARFISPAIAMDAASNASDILTLPAVLLENIVAVTGCSTQQSPHTPAAPQQNDNVSCSTLTAPEAADLQPPAEQVLAQLWDALTACVDEGSEAGKYAHYLSSAQKAHILVHLSIEVESSDSKSQFAFLWPDIQALQFADKTIAGWIALHKENGYSIFEAHQPDSGYSTPITRSDHGQDEDEPDHLDLGQNSIIPSPSPGNLREFPSHLPNSLRRSYEAAFPDLEASLMSRKRRRGQASAHRLPSPTQRTHVLDIEAASRCLESSLQLISRHRMHVVVTNRTRFAVVYKKAKVRDGIYQLQHCDLPVVLRHRREYDATTKGRAQTAMELVGEVCVAKGQRLEWPRHSGRIRDVEII